MTLSMSAGSTMILGIVGCDVLSQTVKAVSVIPGVFATSLKGGAVSSGEIPVWSIAWHLAQTCLA